MQEFWEDLIEAMPFGLGFELFSLFLIILTPFVLQSERKKLWRFPAFLYGCHWVFLLIERWTPLDDQLASPEGVINVSMLLFALARSTFLILFRTSLFRGLVGGFSEILLTIIQSFLYVTAGLFVLNFAGVNSPSLFTGSALVTAALGLSLRDTLGNLFAGLSLQAERPFCVGDWIEFEQNPQRVGEVVEINWRATKLRTLDAIDVIVPNAVLASVAIRNFSKPYGYSRRSIYFEIPFDIPTRLVQDLVLEAISDSWGVLADPPPSVVTNKIGESGIEYWVRVFTREFDQRDRVDGQIRDRIWYAMHRNQIPFAFPRRIIDMNAMTQEARAQAEQQAILRREEALKGIDFLDELPPDSLDQLATHAQRQFYAAGETVFRQGDTGDDLFIILTGDVSVSVRHGTRESQVGKLGKGAFFGELSLMTGQVRSASIQASSDCEMLVVNRKDLEPILAANPDLALHISDVLAQREVKRQQHLADMKALPENSEPRMTNQTLLSRIRRFFSLGEGT